MKERIKILQNEGVSIQADSYPVGHSSHPDEIDAFATFLDNVLYGEEGSKKG